MGCDGVKIPPVISTAMAVGIPDVNPVLSAGSTVGAGTRLTSGGHSDHEMYSVLSGATAVVFRFRVGGQAFN
jgi:hypothetical protein